MYDSWYEKHFLAKLFLTDRTLSSHIIGITSVFSGHHHRRAFVPQKLLKFGNFGNLCQDTEAFCHNS